MSSPNPEPPNLENMEDLALSPPHFPSPGEDTSTSSSNSSSQHGSPRNDWMLPGSIWNQLSDPKPQTFDDLHLDMSPDFPSRLSEDQWPSMDMDTDISTFMTDFLQHSFVDPNSLHFGTVFSAPVSPVSMDSQVPQPKVPIPRLRPTVTAPQQPQAFTTSQPTPPSSQSASTPPPMPQESASATLISKTCRPKTSHTTIERRYRTNLNARILALRRAVPALRVLEKNAATQTQGKGLTGASAPRWDFNDVVNERGYVDGVKAAKKNSKGVVLGKAVEYIKALKRRETRLTREAEGLRTLISGLVGGPELLREWEKEWRERFGGEEADEVDEDAEDNEEGDGDADDDAEDGDSDEEAGRAKKRVRVEKKERKAKPPPAPATEKRKRGRPRKNPVPDAPVAALPPAFPHLVLQPPDVSDQHQPSKYLLAAFMLFNFFNSNTPASSPSAAHEGTVLSHNLPDITPVPADPASWNALQTINILVSVLLLLSLVGPHLPKRITRLLPNGLLYAPPPSTASPSQTPKKDGRLASASLTRDAEISRALTSGDEHALRSALGAHGSLYSVFKCVGIAILGSLQHALPTRETTESVMMKQDDIELRGWRRLSQVEVLRGMKTPLYAKIQAFFSFSSKLPPSASPSDWITLALLSRHFSTATATEFWETARRSNIKTSLELLVLDMGIEEAAEIISTAPMPLLDPSNEDSFSPVPCIAAHVVLARTKTLAARQFVASVSGQRLVDMDSESSGSTISPLSDDKEAKMVITAGRELGGPLGELTHLLEKVDRCPAAEVLATLPSYKFGAEHDAETSCSVSGSESSSKSIDMQSEDDVKDTRLLLLATLLYRRIFPTEDVTCMHVLSPPPSPTPKSAELHLALRRALASRAFDANFDTEEARDRVVDILAETRRERSGGLY